MEEISKTNKAMSIYKKLLEVKKRVPYIKKNTKGHNYSYANPSDVLGNLNPVLNELGVILKTEVIDYKTERVYLKPKMVDLWEDGKKVQEKVDVYETMFTINTKMTWIDVETGERDENLFMSAGINGDEKGLGSALTYNERYFLLKFFNIATDSDDPDSFQTKHMSKEDLEKKQNELITVIIGEINNCVTVDELKALKEANIDMYSNPSISSAAKSRYLHITSVAPKTTPAVEESDANIGGLLKKESEPIDNTLDDAERIVAIANHVKLYGVAPNTRMTTANIIKKNEAFVEEKVEEEVTESIDDLIEARTQDAEEFIESVQDVEEDVFAVEAEEVSFMDVYFEELESFDNKADLIEWFKSVIGDLETHPEVNEEELVGFRTRCKELHSSLKN